MSEGSESKQRRSFTEEFKREAVRLAQERGNVAATARDLGIDESCLNRWRCALAASGGAPAPAEAPRPFPGKGNPRDEEVARMQRELARLREENDILKKAVGIFTSRPR